MKNILAIEIKDNKTIVTVAKEANGNYNLLLHKSFGSKPLDNSVYYDAEIVKRIKEELIQMNIYNDLDEKYLTINTKRVVTTTRSFEYKYNTDLEAEKEKYRRDLERTQPKVHINNLLYSKEDDLSLTKQSITAVIEAMEKEYINNVQDWFRKEGIVFTKVIPITQAIQNAVAKKANENETTISVLIEEKFTQLTWLENGRTE